MNQKPLFLAVALIVILVIGGMFCFMSRRPVAVNQPVVTDPVVETPVQPEPEKYPQHIEAIPGNTDEVWYNIPELGVRMKLNKEFAEDLIYSDGMIDDFGKEQTGIYFSTKAIAEAAPECAPRRGGAFGSFYKKTGIAVEDAKQDWLLKKELNDNVIQYDGYYIGYIEIQAVPWFPQHEEMVRRVWRPSLYVGSGAKYIRDGFKTSKIIPQK